MLDLFKSFVDLGAIVVLPILIFIFGIALGTKPKKALVSGIMVGIGFVVYPFRLGLGLTCSCSS